MPTGSGVSCPGGKDRRLRAPGGAFRSWYAGHVLVLGGESPLRIRESKPLSEGKGVAVRRGLKEAGATATT